MPLVSASLQKSLLDIYKAKPKSADEAAKKLAKAYDDYAKNAMALASTPVFTGMEVTLLEKTLRPALNVPGAPPILALAWGLGVMSYWMAPPVAFVGAQAGAVTLALVQPIIVPGLTACFLNLANTEETCAATMATILDAATKMILVALAPPPGVVAPLL